MPSAIANETVKLYWVPAIAAITAPTAAELGAAKDFTCIIETAPSFTMKPNDVDDPSLCSDFVGKIKGTVSVDSTEAVFKFNPDDATFAWVRANLTTGTSGFWLRVDAIAGAVPSITTTGTLVDVAPVDVSYTFKNDPTVGDRKLYTVGLTVPSKPVQDVAVV